MKKLTLLTMLSFWGFISLTAQNEGKTNLLANPGFEDTSYKLFKYESVGNCPDYVAGWNSSHEREDAGFRTGDYNNEGLNKYNVRGQIGFYSADSDTAKNGNKQFIRVARYEWTKPDEWYGDGGMQQTIDVLPSHTYSLTFLYRLSAHTENGTIVPAWVGFQEEGGAMNKKKLYNNLEETWTEKSFTFTTSATAKKATVHLGVTGGYIYSWGGNINLWADFDDVFVADEGESTSISALLKAAGEQMQASVNGLEVCLSGLETGTDVYVYNVVGGLVTSFRASAEEETVYLPAKGIYIIRNGEQKKALKVVVD